MSFTSQNHYIPRWYQKRFFPKDSEENKVYFLDLSPERVKRKDGPYYTRNAIRRLGTKECFKQEHLYTLFFKDFPSDEIERRFFGIIDERGAEAVELFSRYTHNEKSGQALQHLLGFMDAQKIRTPKGLDYLKRISGRKSPAEALIIMGSLWRANITIWQEGVWEIVNCYNSEVKFIMNDHPVTTYNKKLFPGSPSCTYPFDAEIERVGTHTIFPLDLYHCLIITNLEYVRNPNLNGAKFRENPRYFAQTMFDLRKIQTCREIPEQDVLAINYILKNRAKKYIASFNKDWLYPERHMRTTMWNKLGSNKYFIFPDPRKVTFTTGFVAGSDSGPIFAQDEYGRRLNDNNPEVKRKRDEEWKTFHAFQRSWDLIYGVLNREELMKYT